MKVAFSGLLLFSLSSVVSAQTLSNGIRLPEQWPPQYPVPTERHEMPVPYLLHKPQVLPINNGRQLFVDDFLVSRTDLQRVCHTPDFHRDNPVLEPTEKWENTTDGAPYAAPFSDGVWYDEKEKVYKMWYLAGAGTMHKESSQTFYTCYAESKDGKKWRKVNLDVVPGTNVVDTCWRDAATVWLDRFEKDPQKRWKFFNIERRAADKRWQVVLKYSSDGRRWSRGVAQSGDVYDRSTAFYNPFTRRWALSLRDGTPVSGRSRAYIEHENPETLVSLTHRFRHDIADRNMRFWFVPDDKELRHEKYPATEPGIYNFDVIPYESIMLGQYTTWAGPENNVCQQEGIQKRNVVSLGYSRDGFHFHRPTHNAFMNVNETEGAWNWGNVQSVNGTPLIVGDSLYFYASGRRLNKIMWDSYTSTGLAMLRRDGFVSMRAGGKEGYLITEPLTFDGKHLFVNVDVRRRGLLAVELLDRDGQVIPGYGRKDCRMPRGVDKTKLRVTWRKHDDVAALAGKVVRMKFYLTHGDLYAFWVSPWESGESRGFTAGGGPGMSAGGVDKPE